MSQRKKILVGRIMALLRRKAVTFYDLMVKITTLLRVPQIIQTLTSSTLLIVRALHAISLILLSVIHRAAVRYTQVMWPPLKSKAMAVYIRFIMPTYHSLHVHVVLPLYRPFRRYVIRPMQCYILRPLATLLRPVISQIDLHRTVARMKIPQFARLFASVLIIFGMMAGMLLPAITAKADSITWTNDSDFMMNKTGKCGATTMTNLTTSPTNAYNDESCSTNGVDTSLILTKNPYSAGSLVGIKAVAAGSEHSLALKIDGTVLAWGLNSSGQLGNNAITPRELPVQVLDNTGSANLTNVKAIAAGSGYSIALKNDGTVWAWGNNTYGQLGDNTTTQRNIPVQVKDISGAGMLSNITAIAAGSAYSLALKNDGTVWAWGDNTYGQLGDNTTTQRKLPVQVKDVSGASTLSNISSISAGGGHALVVKNDGTVWAWGDNTYGQLGDNTTTQRKLPVQVKDMMGTGALSSITSVSAGGNHSLALQSNGMVWTWGNNVSGQLADNTTTQRNIPIRVKDSSGTSNLHNITMIASGNSNSIALQSDGTVWSWGDNTFGQLGDNTTSQHELPVRVKDVSGNGILTGSAAVASCAKGNHTIALSNDGTILIWGKNLNAQLGDDTNTQRNLPIRVKDSNNSSLSSITAIAASGYNVNGVNQHSLALKSDGTVWTWGYNGYGQLGNNTSINSSQPVQVKDATGTGYLTGITAIAAGGGFSLALRNDGTVWAWGYNTYGQLGDGTTSIRFIPVKVKDATGTGYLTGITAIAAASGQDDHALAVRNDGTVWAWGSNGLGQLGNNTTTNSTLPVQVKDAAGTGYLSNIKSVSANDSYALGHSMALGNDGSVWAWGSNGYGQNGDNTTTQRNLPVQVKDSAGTGNLSSITAISSGGGYGLALKSDGTVWGWGRNNNGQLGDGTTTNRSLPVQVKDALGTGYLTGITAVSASIAYTGGSFHSMVLKNDGTVWSWGNNSTGQVGDGTISNRILPVQVKDASGTGYLSGISAIASADLFSLALKNDGTVWAWGFNSYGNLGDGTTIQRTYPVRVRGVTTYGNLSSIIAIATGGSAQGHSLALRSDGTVWAWGFNSYGNLGDGTTIQRNLPVQVKNASGTGYLSGITAIAANAYFSLALKSDGTVWAWGLNTNGQLGDNTTTQRNIPVQVKDASGSGTLGGITAITAGGAHAAALRNDGTVWAWGLNANGQLGNNTTTQSMLPVQVKDSAGVGNLANITAISAGGSYYLALRNDGTVWAWGANSSVQLGDNTIYQRNLPVQVKDAAGTGFLTNITKISAGSAHSLALRNDGSVWAWGSNSSGNLGDNTTTMRSKPIQVKDAAGTGTLSSITAIIAANSYSMAVSSGGSVWAWGYGGNGQLGNNSIVDQWLPTQVEDTAGSGNLTSITTVAASSSSTHSLALQSDGTVWGWGNNTAGQLTESFSYYLTPFHTLSSTPSATTSYYYPTGTLAGLIVDMGQGKKSKWQSVAWSSDALPSGTSIGFVARTSNDGSSWSAWSDGGTQSTTNSTTATGDLSALPYSRYIELKATLATSDPTATPTLNDFSLSLLNDQVTPPTNASAIAMKKSAGGSTVAAGDWNNSPTPYFSWTAGADNGGGSGIWGYCLYLGQDNTTDVGTTKGLLGTSPLNTDGRCQYATTDTSLDLSAAGTLGSALTSSNNPYYLIVKAIDKAGNVYAGSPASFAFKHDVTPPNNISFVSLPSQFIPNKNVTITWPTTGTQSASDTNSGLVGVQYRIGSIGTWYGANHTGAADDVLSGTGSYTTDPTYDYPLLSDGNNLIYFRSIDAAGNASSNLTSAVIKINSSSPSQPQNLTAIPSNNASNSFAFNWEPPQTYVGSASTLTYCYTVNTLPTAETCSYTAPGQTSLTPGAYATQPGQNNLYVVAKDEAGNINYATHATATFTANTTAPGIPLNAEIADISVKTTASWKLAISWEPPTSTGAGVASYRIFRSTTAPDSGFTQVASTSGNSYVDTNLNAVKYYYKIKACDSANHCGAETPEVHMLPTGRYTTPAEITGTPTVVVGTKKATISWTTARGSDSKVQYGTTAGQYFTTEAAISDQTKSHRIELTGLEAGTTYYYKAKWTDEDGNTGSTTDLVFKTLPAPVISDVQVLKATLTSAIIQFTSKDATQVSVYYGKSGSFGGLKQLNTSTNASTYSIELPSLDDGSTYNYRLDPTDNDGYSYTGTSLSFTTPPRPRITNVRFQPITGEPTSTQKVTWTTNVPTSSTVTYGLTGTNGGDIYDSKMVTDHSIIIKNLQDDSNYFLLAQSRDIDGNLAVSDKQLFKTALDTRPPVISDITVETSIRGNGSEARGQVIVSWHTDEPATSQVAYGEGSGLTTFNNRSNEDATLSTEHVVIISDLPTSRVYTVQPISKDKADNQTNGDGRSAIIGRPSDSVITIVLNTLRKVFGF